MNSRLAPYLTGRQICPVFSLERPVAPFIRWSSSGSRWKQRQGRDSYARGAKVQGLKSRAAFKLLEVREDCCISRITSELRFPLDGLQIQAFQGEWTDSGRSCESSFCDGFPGTDGTL
jgi:hypothetical protein